MATEEKNVPPTISPEKRKMLQQWYEHGSRSSAKGDWDYAHRMFVQCVQSDPCNQLYVQSFLGNLQKKYQNNKKGGAFAGVKGAGARAGMKKAMMQKNWPALIENGLKYLELNPWEIPVLMELATACQAYDADEALLVWLRGALDADTKNVDVNRMMGRTLGAMGRFDEAIICWQRILQTKPQDEEARRASADLQVKKTIHQGGYEGANSSTDVMVDKQDKHQTNASRLSPEQQLEKQIAKTPGEISKYIELADLHRVAERFEEEEKVIQRALQAAGGGDMALTERLEDVQIKRQKQALEQALRVAASEKTPEAEQLVQQMRVELNHRETQMYQTRSERYPDHAGYRYELGIRLMRGGKFQEAINTLQRARSDPRRKGSVLLALGTCFLRIEQPGLALTSFETAVNELSERDLEQKKEAMYMAGRVAASKMKDYEKAENYLSQLAGLDFSYKDVGDLLDKVRKLRHKG